MKECLMKLCLNPLQVQTKLNEISYSATQLNESQSPIGTNKTLSLCLLQLAVCLSQSPIGTNKTMRNWGYFEDLKSLNPLQVQTKHETYYDSDDSDEQSQSPIGTNKTLSMTKTI